MASSSSKLSNDNYDLVDFEETRHLPTCKREPSRCLCPEVSWIWASKPNRPESINSGKWMLFPWAKFVDETWIKVKNLILSGKLGDTANVSPASAKSDSDNPQHVICIYSNDHEDVSDVFRVLIDIRQNRLSKTAIHYKTDEATLSGIYTSTSGRATDPAEVEKRHPNFRVSKYTTPKVENASDWLTGITMYRNNVGPEFNQGLVAELTRAKRPENNVGGIQNNWRIRNYKSQEEETNLSPSGRPTLLLKGYEIVIHNPPKIVTTVAQEIRRKPIQNQ